jgi:mannobiose 2-epimerase
MYTFVRRSFVDARDGGFVFKVSRDGTRVVDAKKQLFAESYAIFALATYGRVFAVPEAIELGLARFASIDAARHDAASGGYDQTGDPGFITSGAARDTNTQLHLLEAFTALYEASGDPRVGARLDELIDLFASTLRQADGHVAQEFDAAWAPFGTPVVSYGHDLETSWLLLDAARVLGRAGDNELREAALAIAAHSAERGIDAQRGGYFELGVPGGAVTDRDKIWWVQFEALNGLWWAFDTSKDELYLDRLSATLDWIEASEDLPIGEWFATTNADGSASGSANKGDEWKESYHPVRALVYLEDWIDAARAALLAR